MATGDSPRASTIARAIAPRKPLLAVREDGIGQLALAGAGDEIRRRVALAPIHAHVERFIALEAESAS